jgi:hypothetical protein
MYRNQFSGAPFSAASGYTPNDSAVYVNLALIDIFCTSVSADRAQAMGELKIA